MNKNNTILEVKGLTVAFGGRTVVDDVNFTLQRGRTLGIVGESGSGKSVSTLALMGLLPKNATVGGSANLSGEELLTLGDNELRAIRGKRISMIFQEPMTSLNPVQKCGEQVLEMMHAHEGSDGSDKQAAKERVIKLFEEVLLPRPDKIFDSYPHEISGGQKQRVMIAMALMNNPDILIADEPTTALDVTVQKTILDLLRQLQEKHGTSISFDLNYRASFWEGREAELSSAFSEIASLADILIGNEEDFQLCLGFKGPEAGGKDIGSKIDSFKAMIGQVKEKYPDAMAYATTLRQVITAEKHLWGAILYAGGEWYVEEPRKVPVLDRIGGGDGFSGGLLYGVLSEWEPEKWLQFGWASGALAVSGINDYAEPADEKQIWDIYAGNARVQR